jgi:hypothetical protein
MYDFGPLAAQNDQTLLSYFHVTRQAKRLTDFSSSLSNLIFVARPGSGKTALLSWLHSLHGSFTPVFLRSDETRFSSGDEKFTLGDYRLLVGAELNVGLISEVVERNAAQARTLRSCRDFLEERWWGSLGRFLANRLSGLSILGVGFSLNPQERREYLREIRQTKKVEMSNELIRQITGERPLALIVDDPELIVGEGLIDVTQENAIRLGAFLSVLSNLHAQGVRVLVFIKEHILQNIRAHYLDFPHFADRIDGLEWTEEDLRTMLNLRVETRLKAKWSDVFTLTPADFQKAVLPFLINGPRDLIELCNLAGKEEGKITKPRLVKSITVLRSDKWHEIAAQYGQQWPRVDQFSRSLVASMARKFPAGVLPPGSVKAEFETQFSQPGSEIHNLRIERWIDRAKFESPPVEERLFLIGCLGYVFEGKRYYPWAGRSLERFRQAESYFISPLFLS